MSAFGGATDIAVVAENSAFLKTRHGKNHTLDHTLARGGVVPRSRAAGTQIIFLTAFKATALRGHWRRY